MSETSGSSPQHGIGRDQWVEQSGGRTARPTGQRLAKAFEHVPVPVRILAALGVALLWAVISPTDYTTRIAFMIALYTLLAAGLNLVVGWVGMLDLGYAAFFGVGAYAFALLSSPKFDLHWSAWVAVPVVVVGVALLGFLVGLPSRKLSGDYLAIVTLFFGQIFLSITVSGDRLQLKSGSWAVPKEPFNLTGGPNGLTNIDGWNLFGVEMRSITAYYVLTAVITALVMIGMYRLRDARVGLAMRSIREDSLAAGVLSVPVNRLRLIAFALGAAVAGLAGTIYAAAQQSVFSSNFDVNLLIILYAAVILGGLGSIGGGLVGAAVMIIVPELLRDADRGRVLLFGAIAVLAVWKLRPWIRLAEFVGALLAAALVTRLGLAVFDVTVESPSGVGAVERWLVPHLSNSTSFGNVTFLLAVAGALALTVVRARWRAALGGVVTYITLLAWENRLAEQVSITRQLLIGAVLVGVISTRPHGFFGARRVEVL